MCNNHIELDKKTEILSQYEEMVSKVLLKRAYDVLSGFVSEVRFINISNKSIK